MSNPDRSGEADADISAETRVEAPENEDAPNPGSTSDDGAGPLARFDFLLRPLGLLILLAFAVWTGSLVRCDANDGGDITHAHDHEGSESTTIYTCSMHPQIRMPHPGTCPICGMELIVATEESGSESGDADDPGRVSVSHRSHALAQIRTRRVERTQPKSEIRLLGHVDHDETRLRTVTAWTSGRIDRLQVRATGDEIRRGQVVAKLYSPEVYAAMRDLVIAKRQADRLAGGEYGSPALARDALESSRKRLRLLGVSKSLIASIEDTGKAPDHIDIRTPYSGTVLERFVEEGQYVRAGGPLFSTADLSRVWVQIDAFESDLPHVRVGQSVDIELPGNRGLPLVGTVSFIDPVLDMKRRTARVRVEVQNADEVLRPGMFAEAVIAADVAPDGGELTVPASAVLFTGTRSVVYVEVPNRQEPTYELRSVRLGARSGPVYPVISGLSEGENVVSQGAFSLDADLQLAGGQSMMTLPDDRTRAPESTHEISDEFQASLAALFEHYLVAQTNLASDDVEGSKRGLSGLVDVTESMAATSAHHVAEFWESVADELTSHARHGAESSDAAVTRAAFEAVSLRMLTILEMFGNPTDGPLRIAFCPMAFDAKGARWIQREHEIANPYYGTAMLRCGEIRATVHPGEPLATGPKTPFRAAAAGHQH